MPFGEKVAGGMPAARARRDFPRLFDLCRAAA
jgi:hypothetical protein